MVRKLALFLIALALLATPAFAETTATFGDQNSSGEYRMKATFDGTSGVITFASNTGIYFPYENYTTPNTANALIAAESGKTITDTGGAVGTSGNASLGACSKHTLPRAAPGMVFSFSTGSNCTMTVDTVDTSDTILYSISGARLDAGDSIKSTGQAGDSVTLFSTVANQWQIKEMHAIWTDNGTN